MTVDNGYKPVIIGTKSSNLIVAWVVNSPLKATHWKNAPKKTPLRSKIELFIAVDNDSKLVTVAAKSSISNTA